MARESGPSSTPQPDRGGTIVPFPCAGVTGSSAFADDDKRMATDSLVPHARGIGNTALADANACGKITWMSLFSTWVLTGAAPWFWPFTNLVGPYGIRWPANVELS